MRHIDYFFGIFGASGDLTFRKLLPALFNLYCIGSLPEETVIACIARRNLSQEEYRTKAEEWIRKFTRVKNYEEQLPRFLEKIIYYCMDLRDKEAYHAFQSEFRRDYTAKQLIYYYAVAPELFLPITEGLQYASCIDRRCSVIVEKPFGETIEKARELNALLQKNFGKEHVYHIDHYLGKEMIQNIFTVRFQNILFREMWNSECIEDVQISAFEEVGVESRAGYYDKSGAMKDMVQNHLFQVLSIVAMEPPQDNSTDAIHNAQLQVFEELRPISPSIVEDHLLLAQYEGYREEDRVAKDSRTETYAAMKLYIDNPRWEGVPFFIRTGKALRYRETFIVIRFRSTDRNVDGDKLIIKVQPEEGINLEFNIKKPGQENTVFRASMDFCQSCMLMSQSNTPEAYERLLYAATQGDRSLFSEWKQVEASWAYVENAMKAYRDSNAPIYTYARGSLGPKEADRLTKQTTHGWELDNHHMPELYFEQNGGQG